MNKKSTPPPNPQPKKKLNLPTLIALALCAAIVIGGTVFFINYNHNYAAEVAAPIEKELIKAGAVKKCSSGRTGKEFLSSTSEPWYGATFTTSLSEEEAAVLITGITKGNDYSVIQSTRREFVKDFEDTTKMSSYQGLEYGPVKLRLSTYSGGENGVIGGCSSENAHSVVYDKKSVAITLTLGLPPRK